MTALPHRLLLSAILPFVVGPVGLAALPPKDRHADPLPPGALARLGTRRFRLSHEAMPVVLSADARLIATVTNGRLVLLDAATGERVRTFGQNVDTSVRPLFTPDGKMLVTVESGRTVCFWEVATGERRRRQDVVPELALRLSGLAISADGKYVATGHSPQPRAGALKPGVACVWETATWKQFGPFRLLHNAEVQVALSADGKRLATWGFEYPPAPGLPRQQVTVQLWDVARGGAGKRLLAPGSYMATSVSFAPDGRTLAITSNQPGVGLWDAGTGKALRRLDWKSGTWPVARFSPDGKLLAALTGGGATQLWDTPSWKALDPPAGPRCPPAGLVFPSGAQVVAYGVDGRAVCLWDARTGKARTPTGGHHAAVLAATFAEQSKRLLSASEDGAVLEWDRAAGRQRRAVHLGGDLGQRADLSHWQPLFQSGYGRWQLALSRDGRYVAAQMAIAAAGVQGGIGLWQTASGKKVAKLTDAGLHSDLQLAFAADGKRLAAGGHGLSFWKIPSGAAAGSLQVGAESSMPAPATSEYFALSPDGQVAATVAHSGIPGQKGDVVTLWDLDSAKAICRLEGPAPILALTFSPDSTVLATGGRGGVTLWDAFSGKALRRIEVRWGSILRLAFSPDGRTLAGGTYQPASREGHTVYVWEVASGQARFRFRGHEEAISCLAFAPDGSVLASGSWDTTMLLWDVAGRFLIGGAGRRQPAALWADLASDQAEPAFRAIVELAADPDAALALLKKRLRPPGSTGLEKEPIRILIADLDDPARPLREKATQELIARGKAAVPWLRVLMNGARSLEHRRRMEAVLARLERQIPYGADLRVLRGIEVLERIGTPAARHLLTAFAREDNAVAARQARAALERLRRRR